MAFVSIYLFDFLNRAEAPQKADCIFVLAGKHERKVFGIDLWQRGLAPELILSVGRFEWRQFYTLGLPADGGLQQLVDKTEPKKRHFFVHFHDGQVESYLIAKGRFGTWSEGKALFDYIYAKRYGSIMIVSTSIHLRRIALAFDRYFRAIGTRLIFVAVPEKISFLQRSELRYNPRLQIEVFRELFKYLGYLVISVR